MGFKANVTRPQITGICNWAILNRMGLLYISVCCFVDVNLLRTCIACFTQMVTLIVMINSLPRRQNGRHFADDILICTFKDDIFCILAKISLKFVPKGPIDLARNRRQAIFWTSPDPIYWRIYASLRGDELNKLGPEVNAWCCAKPFPRAFSSKYVILLKFMLILRDHYGDRFVLVQVTTSLLEVIKRWLKGPPNTLTTFSNAFSLQIL